MQFTSLSFAVFFLIILFGGTFLRNRFRIFFLLAASVLFALFISGFFFITFLAYLIIFSVFNLILVRFKEQVGRKIFFAFVIVFLVLILALFKYSSFLTSGINLLADSGFSSTISRFTPLGISYITFQLISYFADVNSKRIEPEKSTINFLLYILYFPKLLSGPIERGASFLHQLKHTYNFDYKIFLNGLKIFIWGFFLKSVIADRLIESVDKVFFSPSDFSSFQVFISAIFFTIQLYTDFAGYTFMALGTSAMLGIKLTNNFRAPFFSKSISEFWTRWHITLSSWLRDYIFLPLSIKMSRTFENRNNFLNNENFIYAFASIVTMSICGLWHGTKITMLLWGVLHGLFLSIGFITKKQRKKIVKKLFKDKNNPALKIFRTILVLTLIIFSFVFFRSDTPDKAFSVIHSIFRPWTSFDLSGLFFIGVDTYIALTTIAFMIIVETIYYRRNLSDGSYEIHNTLNIPVIILLIILITLFGKFGATDFIYFKF